MWINGELCEFDGRFEDRMRGAVELRETKQRLFDDDGRLSLIERLPDSGIAVLRVHGPIVRQESPWYANFETLMADLDYLEGRESITGCIIDFDSPGGIVMGSAEACERIQQFGKPIVAFASGYMTSLAYKLGCFCDAIYAAPSAEIGNIGTRFSLIDYSKAYEIEGLQKLDFVTGPYKAVGSPGAEVTADHKQFLQSWVNRTYEHFQQALTVRGLSPEQAAAVSDGRWWGAKESIGLGLIDSITSLPELIESMSTQPVVTRTSTTRPLVRQSTTQKAGDPVSKGTTDQPASTGTTTETAPAAPVQTAAPQQAAPVQAAASQPAAATLQQLEEACPGASSDFLLTQLKGGATVAAAQTAFILHQQQQMQAQQAAQQAAATVQSVAGDPPSAGQTLASDSGTGAKRGGTGTADPIQQFESLVEDAVKEHGGNRGTALQAMVSEHSELYARYRTALQSMSASDVARRRRRIAGRRLALTH